MYNNRTLPLHREISTNEIFKNQHKLLQSKRVRVNIWVTRTPHHATHHCTRTLHRHHSLPRQSRARARTQYTPCARARAFILYTSTHTDYISRFVRGDPPRVTYTPNNRTNACDRPGQQEPLLINDVHKTEV